MQEQLQDQVKSLAQERHKALAEKNGWTVEFAAGFAEGESKRRNAEPAPRVALIGIDQYALGFRAGFFERRQQESRTPTRNASADISQLRFQA